ncbi:MAG: transaldolase [Deltaproteobacteria bacterium]|nr:MAG: transaldolase [Deltaproteobacteria bacterium]
MNKNPLERLFEVNTDAEIWWDSSPLIYQGWAAEMVKKAPDQQKAKIWQEQFERMYNPDHPERGLFRGVTTNPPLSLKAIKANEPYWENFVENLVKENPGIDKEKLFWLTYKEIVKRGAQMYQKVFEDSGYKYGYLSGQLDPRVRNDVDTMVAQAEELHSLNPNVMIKVPGTKEGYEVIRILTSKGIPTNNTLAFMIPQFLAAANAVKKGLEEAKANGVDLSQWRSVITAMSARYGTLGDLKKEAEERNIELTESDIRWAEISIFKKAYRLIKEGGYPSKMLLCSMRVSPIINGKPHCWHLEKIAGADIVYTCPPPFIEKLMFEYEDIEFKPDAIYEDPPKDVLDKLLRIPYFERGYMEDGYTPDEFNTHSALVATAIEFSNATQGMIDFVAKHLN